MSGKKFISPPPNIFFTDLIHYFFRFIKFCREKIILENKYFSKIARAIRYASEDKVLVIFTIWRYNIKFILGHDMEFV